MNYLPCLAYVEPPPPLFFLRGGGNYIKATVCPFLWSGLTPRETSRFLPARRVNKEEQESPNSDFSWAANFHGLEGGCTQSGHQACR